MSPFVVENDHGRIAPAPVFFVVDDGNDDSRGWDGASTMGRLAAVLSAFHLSQAGVPAASMTSVKMADDHLPSIEKDFFDPLSRSRSASNDMEWDWEAYRVPWIRWTAVSSQVVGSVLTSIAIVGLAY